MIVGKLGGLIDATRSYLLENGVCPEVAIEPRESHYPFVIRYRSDERNAGQGVLLLYPPGSHGLTSDALAFAIRQIEACHTTGVKPLLLFSARDFPLAWTVMRKVGLIDRIQMVTYEEAESGYLMDWDPNQ